MTTRIPLAELTETMNRLARTPGLKELLCAADVAAAVKQAIPPAPAVTPAEQSWKLAGGIPGPIAALIGVQIIISGDSPPGTLRLIRHYDPATRRTTCDVHGDTVSHTRCAVILDGTLDPP